MRVTRRYLGIDPIPFRRKAGGFLGPVDMQQVYYWIAPGTFTMDTQTRDVADRAKAIRFHHLTFITPETERSTHYFSRNRATLRSTMRRWTMSCLTW